MVRQYGRAEFDDTASIDRTRLSVLTLLFGWMGSHRFYLGNDMLGAVYFAVTIVGLAFTLYYPLWVTVFGFNINLAVVILLVPFMVSIIEFFVIRRYSEGELSRRYRPTGESLTLVFVSQFIYLFLISIHAISNALSE
jgi:hypothetical protein